MRDCVKRLIAASENKLNNKEAKQILKTIDRSARRLAANGINYDSAVKAVVNERMKVSEDNIAKLKVSILRDTIKLKQANNRISELVDAGLSYGKAWVAELEGVSSNIEGSADSFLANKTAVEKAYMNKLIGDLQRENLLGLLNGKALNDEIGKELWAISAGKKGETKIPEAARIAEIIANMLEDQRLRMNDAGADIGKTAGYLMSQNHDTAKMLQMGRDGWSNFMAELLDPERSFGGDFDDLFDVLRGAYDALVTGVRMRDPIEQGGELFQFKGYADLARRLSQSRQMHFKDYASWKKWNETLGSVDLSEGIYSEILQNAKNITLLERYGTNPEAMLKQSLQDTSRKYRQEISESGKRNVVASVEAIIDNALDKNLIAANPTYAQWGSLARVFNEITALGGATLSSISDLALISSEYKFQGKGYLESKVLPFKAVFDGIKSKDERIKQASLFGVGVESMIAGIWRFSPQDNLSGRASKVRRLFFKANLQNWWTDTHRAAMSRVMTHDLGLMKDLPFDKLGEDTQRLFGNYRITPEMWDKMRKNVHTLEEDGRDYILADFMPDRETKEALLKYVAGRAYYGVLDTDARISRYATGGTQRGTIGGEAMRLMMQFKSFPISVMTKIWGRALYGKGRADMGAIADLFLMTLLFGYLAGSMKDLVKNKTPKDPAKLETWYASLMQGGGFGIAGDLLFQEYTFGRTLGDVVAGPTIGKAGNIFKIYSEWARGESAARQALNTAIGLVPGNNLFYVRPAFDQLLLLRIQEEMNPGYLRRMERNMKKTYGQELLFK
jgi:hypothetical protein